MRDRLQADTRSQVDEAQEGGIVMLTVHRAPHFAGVVALLERNSLPTSDLDESLMDDFLYVGDANAPTGIVGVQILGANALLRSLAVNADHRARGLGQLLVHHAEEHARSRGATAIFLLTTTAEAFFRARGYAAQSRDTAPADIRSTHEFADLCPASSAFLSKQI